MPTVTPIVRLLLVANIAGYALQWLTNERITVWLALWPPGETVGGTSLFHYWQLVTHAFMHDPTNIAHLLANSFGLWMFGPDVERLLGTRRFAVYYLTSILGAALAQLGVDALTATPSGPMLGASGGVFGLLLAYGLAFPHRRLMLIFPPIPMPAWLFVTLYGVLELGLGLSQTADKVAHFAHLGGMAAGFLLIVFWRANARTR